MKTPRGAGARVAARGRVVAFPARGSRASVRPLMSRSTRSTGRSVAGIATVASVAVMVFALAAACGAPPDARGPASAGGPPAGSAAPTAGTAPQVAAKDPCDRVCAVETRCGKDLASCRARCKPIGRVLAATTVDAMAACVESKVPPSCEGFPKIVHGCLMSSLEGHDEEARANLDVFANAFCEQKQKCSGESGFSKSQCLGEAKSAMRGPDGEAAAGGWAIYGAMRPSSVDRMAECLKAPCETRKIAPDAELERCLDALLAGAAEEP